MIEVTEFKAYAAKVNEAIQMLGVDPKTCATDEPNKWYLHRGKANVVLFVRESETYDKKIHPTLVLVSPIMTLPSNPQLLLRLHNFLMGVNHQMITECFSMDEDQLYMRATAYLEDLSADGIARMVDNLSFYADYFVKELDGELEALDQKLNDLA